MEEYDDVMSGVLYVSMVSGLGFGLVSSVFLSFAPAFGVGLLAALFTFLGLAALVDSED